MKGISGDVESMRLYGYTTEGVLKEVPTGSWHIQAEDGTTPEKLSEDALYEVHVSVEDGGVYDLSAAEKEIKVSVVLGR